MDILGTLPAAILILHWNSLGSSMSGSKKWGHGTHLVAVRFILGRTGRKSFYKLCVLHSQTCFSHLLSCLAGSCSYSFSSWDAPVRTIRLGRCGLTQFVLNGQVRKKGDNIKVLTLNIYIYIKINKSQHLQSNC